MFIELLREIREKEVVITYENGKLQYSGPEQNINDEFIAKLKKYKHKLKKHYWPSDCPNMMPINTEGNKIPFILLHAGEANYSISEYLGRDQPFYGFFYIGSEGEKIKFKSVEAFAASYVKQLKKILPSGPYFLGGFSFGGVLAYEIAMQLQEDEQDIPALILVDAIIPSLVSKNNITHNIFHVKIAYKNFLYEIYYYTFYNIRYFIYKIFQSIKLKLPVKWRNYYIVYRYTRLTKKYKPNKVFNGYTLLFKTEENDSNSKFLGWDHICTNLQLEIIKGNHNNMYKESRSIIKINKKISKLFDEATKP